ncbi:MAG: TatD family deoxyribonuclease [Dehalococcoidia bacterium]|nr:MAG: TatD family deoxyribonuclease [Dehalococcoidia bacterium]
MRLIDTHSHIHDAAFDADRDAAIERARAAGVEYILTLGVDAADSRRAVELAERYACVLAAAGVHPHDAAEAIESDLDALEELARHPRVAAVGEIGLDFYRNLSPREAQLRVLRRQLETATRVGKPVAVHCREAEPDMFGVLSEWSGRMGGCLRDGRPLGVMHYFSGDTELASRYIGLGFFISVHTSVTHPRAEQLREVARTAPLDRLVVETDSPYGAPQSVRGKRNEPAHVAEAAARIAELRSMDVAEVARITTDNALRLLGAGVTTGGRSSR